MSVWPIEFNPAYLYFITTRAVRAAHLFRQEAHKQIILASWAYMQTAGWLKVYAFVIMPNHIHLIVQCAPEHPISDVVRDFKKYTAKQIIAAYKAADHAAALSFLRAAA